MANKAFNSIDGYSVGQPANVVIDGSGNANLANTIITGNANVTGNLNVTGNANVLGNVVIDGTANFITGNANFNSNINISDIANLHIPGGDPGYGIATDGFGNLSWYSFSGGGGGNGTPGGSDKAIQFNQAGAFGGSSLFNYDYNTSTFFVQGFANIVGTANISTANIPNLRSSNANFAGTSQLNLGNLAYANYITAVANVLTSNLTVSQTFTGNTALFIGNVQANYFIGNGSQLTGIAAGSISNGTSNLQIPIANGPITMGSNGAPNVFVASYPNGVSVISSLTIATYNPVITKTIL